MEKSAVGPMGDSYTTVPGGLNVRVIVYLKFIERYCFFLSRGKYDPPGG